MIFNGTIPTTITAIHRMPPVGGAVNLMRVVNESGVTRTFTIKLRASPGSDSVYAFTPVDVSLLNKECYDDFPSFEMAGGGEIHAVASGDGLSWTINAR
jgi:hypothetical protein